MPTGGPDRWEYATMRWEGSGFGSKREIEFSHQVPRLLKLGHIRQIGAIAMLGEHGYELMNVSGRLDDDANSVSTWRRLRS